MLNIKTVGVDCGHTMKGADYGAVGKIVESDATRVLGKKVMAGLKANGVKVVDCTVDTASSQNASLQERCRKERAAKCDLFLSIHFNAGGGVGSEIYVVSNASANTRATAKKVLNEVVASCKFTNRGLKTAGFYVLKNTNAPAMLLEVCFVDTDDYKKYDPDKVANAIVKAITGKEIQSPQPSKPSADATAPSGSEIKTRGVVTASKLNVRKSDSTSASVIGSVVKDEEVEIKWTTLGWHYIRYSAGSTYKEGYVSADYIRVYKKAYNCHNKNAPIRSKASTSGSSAGNVGAGQLVNIKWTESGFYYVRTESGVQGYVEAGFLKMLT